MREVLLTLGVLMFIVLLTAQSVWKGGNDQVIVSEDGQVAVEFRPWVWSSDQEVAVLMQRGHQHFWVWEREWRPVESGSSIAKYLDEVYAEHLLKESTDVE